MAIVTVTQVKKTRGAKSRPVEFQAIGKMVQVKVNREKQVKLDAEGNKVLDADGEEIMVPILDAEGKPTTREEIIEEFKSEGVVTEFTDLVEFAATFTNGDAKAAEQLACDWAAEGYNDWAFSREVNRDEFADFIRELGLDEEKASQFRRSARLFAAMAEISILDAALVLKTNMQKNLAAA